MNAKLVKAQALLDRLADDVCVMAQLLAEPALSRDAAALSVQWQSIMQFHAPLSSAYRKLRKVTRSTAKSAESRAAQDQVKALHWTLRLWDEMGHIVEQHMDAPAQQITLQQTNHPQDALITYLYAALHILANPNEQHEEARENDCFADIAMDIQKFEQLVTAAYRLLSVQGRTRTARFLDVGCGGATKVLAAARWFDACDGLEYDPGYAKAGQRTLDLLMPGRGQVFEVDALTFDNYGAYDVIYYYRPIANLDLLFEMQTRIVEQAKPGTIILAPYNRFLDPRPPFPCAQIKGPIFVTGVTQEEADIWHANAERTAVAPILRSDDLRKDPGVWRPILEAASYNGSQTVDPKLLPEEKAYQVFSAAET